MQGLTSYDDSDPDSPPTHAPTSRRGGSGGLSSDSKTVRGLKNSVDGRDSKTGLDGTGSDPSRTITSIALNPGRPSTPRVPSPQAQQSSASAFNTKKPLSIGIKLNRQNSNAPVTPGGSQSRSYGRMGTGAKSRFDEPDQEQVDSSRSGEMGPADDEANDEGGNDDGGLAGGLTEDELFRKMTAPRGWTATGWEDEAGPVQAESSASGSGSALGTGTRSRELWEIPELTAELPEPGLQNKVDTYLKLKLERDQHINTTLLSSTAFANPHIYSKLVEFVNIDERGTAFPDSGWLTRRGLEDRRSVWGAKHLADLQKRDRDAVERVQREGGRRGIDFAPAASRSTLSGPGNKGTTVVSKGKERQSQSGDYPFVLSLPDQLARPSGSKRDDRDRERDRDRDRGKRKDRGGPGIGEDDARYEREKERKRERWKDGG